MYRILWLVRRTRQVVQTEGLRYLLARGLGFFVACVFRYEKYYLYERVIDNIRNYNEVDFKPKIENLTLKMVSTNEQADELEAAGLEFRSQVRDSRELLDKGAVAFCIFIKRQLANIGWVVLNRPTHHILFRPAHKVDFENGEAVFSGVMTNPRFLRRGLTSYSLFKRVQFCSKKGIRVDRCLVAKNNVPSQAATAKFGGHIYAEGIFIKIFWWERWREKNTADFTHANESSALQP